MNSGRGLQQMRLIGRTALRLISTLILTAFAAFAGDDGPVATVSGQRIKHQALKAVTVELMGVDKENGSVLPVLIRSCSSGSAVYTAQPSSDQRLWTAKVPLGTKLLVEFTRAGSRIISAYEAPPVLQDRQLLVIPVPPALEREWNPEYPPNPRRIQIDREMCRKGPGALWIQLTHLHSNEVGRALRISNCEVVLERLLPGRIQGILFLNGQPIGYTLFDAGYSPGIPRTLTPKFLSSYPH